MLNCNPFKNILFYLFIYFTDKRITENPILASPLFMIAIFTLYILIVRKWGPKYMEDRKPFKVDELMKLYNVVQILLNAFIFYEALRYSYWRSDFSFTCEGYNPNDMRMPTLKGTRPAYLYHVSKYLDLLDTVGGIRTLLQNKIKNYYFFWL